MRPSRTDGSRPATSRRATSRNARPAARTPAIALTGRAEHGTTDGPAATVHGSLSPGAPHQRGGAGIRGSRADWLRRVETAPVGRSQSLANRRADRAGRHRGRRCRVAAVAAMDVHAAGRSPAGPRTRIAAAAHHRRRIRCGGPAALVVPPAGRRCRALLEAAGAIAEAVRRHSARARRTPAPYLAVAGGCVTAAGGAGAAEPVAQAASTTTAFGNSTPAVPVAAPGSECLELSDIALAAAAVCSARGRTIGQRRAATAAAATSSSWRCASIISTAA